jgi:two-component system heavy metal sensor histidine kinase CusS
MSSKSGKARPSTHKRASIVSSLVVSFTLACTGLLGIAMAFLYGIVVHHIDQEDAGFIRAKLVELRTELQAGPDAIDAMLPGANLRAGFPSAFYYVRILSVSGGLIAETPGMDGLIPKNRFPAPINLEAPARAPLEYVNPHGQWFFLLAAVAKGPGDQRFLVQVAQDRSNDKHFIARFALLLGIVFLGAILAAVVIGQFVAKRALGPLREMTRAVQRVEVTQRNARVEGASWPTELRALADAFDRLLGRLEESFSRLSQFSADLAHELRTPVSSMRGEAEVALFKARDSTEYRTVLESTLEELDRLSQVIDSLLFLARAESPETQLEWQEVEARKELEGILEFYDAMAEERRVTVVLEGEGKVLTDRTLFRRAVSNLVGNALENTPPGGKVAVLLVSGPRQVDITVSDTGPGISAEHLPRLFDRFYRADESRHLNGAGLGLAIVKSIMQIHGGSAQVMSRPGKGAQFVLSFPLK